LRSWATGPTSPGWAAKPGSFDPGVAFELKSLGEYLDELEKTKEGRPDQVREGLESFIDLWRMAIEKGVVSEAEPVDEALQKVEAKGGLYKASED